MSLIFAAAADVSHAAETARHIDWWGVFSVAGTLISMAAGLFFIFAGTIGVLRLPEDDRYAGRRTCFARADFSMR